MPKIWGKRRLASVKIAVLSTPSLKPTSEHMLIWGEGGQTLLGIGVWVWFPRDPLKLSQ